MNPIHVGQEDRAYYLRLIDVVRDGIICTDVKERIVFINRTASIMWGYEDTEIVGELFKVMFVEEDRDGCCKHVFQETLRHGQYEGQFLFQRKDGSRFPGYLSSSRLLRGDGQQEIVFVIHDFTEQKKLQTRLFESQKLASLGKMVEGVSHEIRNPIVTLGGYARRLSRDLGPNHPGQEYIRIMLKDVQRMEEMLQDVEGYLQFAQAHPPSFDKVDLQDLMRDVIERLSVPDNVRLEEDYPPKGPQIFGNGRHVQELFHHLLENAVEAMPGGGLLHVQLRKTDHQARVRIRDSGAGIPKDAIPDIYSPFFTTKTKGAGVGLAKAYIIVEEHAGQIEVQSKVEKGTTFTLTFPTDRRHIPRRNAQV